MLLSSLCIRTFTRALMLLHVPFLIDTRRIESFEKWGQKILFGVLNATF